MAPASSKPRHGRARPKTRICFVCLGNICRSPTAQGIMRQLVADAGLSECIEVDSAGTGAWYEGKARDERSRETAAARGVSLEGRARRFLAADFDAFDYVVAMDRSNVANLLPLARSTEHRQKVSLLRAHGENDHLDVPDPYREGARGFELVFDICEANCRALLAHVTRERGLDP